MFQHHNYSVIEKFVLEQSVYFRQIGIDFFYHIHLECYADAKYPIGQYPADLVERYIKEGLYLYDQALHHCMSDGGPIFRSQIDEYLAVSPMRSEYFYYHNQASVLYEKYKIYDLYYLPIFHDRPAVFVVAATRMPVGWLKAVTTGVFEQLQKIASEFHSFALSHGDRPGSRGDQLLELLGKSDCTLAEAANVMEIEISTANKHAKAAKRKYNATTLQGAVYQATIEGAISNHSNRRRSRKRANRYGEPE